MKRPTVNRNNGDGVDFLAGFYDPPMAQFWSQDWDPFQRAKAAAWGEALKTWLEGHQARNTRNHYRQSMASLLSFCQKPPWKMNTADAARWLKRGLAGKTNGTQDSLARGAGLFYVFAQEQTWTSPTGRRLRLCRRNPMNGVKRPKVAYQLRVAPLRHEELEQLLAAFDRETPYGRRDLALFTVLLETGLHLREALKLRLRDVSPAPDSQTPGAEDVFQGNLPRRPNLAGVPAPDGRAPGADSQLWQDASERRAAWEAVRGSLEADGRLEGMGPDDYIFIPMDNLSEEGEKRNSQDWGRKPLAAHTAMAALKQYAEWAGLDPRTVSPEKLRYSGALRLVKAGASAQKVGQFLRLKSMPRTWQVRKRLKEWLEREQKNGENPFLVNPGERPPESKRRRPGGQPGNRNHLKHGKKAARFRLKRLGIEFNRFTQVDASSIPDMLEELDQMRQELDELPEVSWDVAVKKLIKLSYLTYVSGRLIVMYLLWIRKQRDQGD